METLRIQTASLFLRRPSSRVLVRWRQAEAGQGCAVLNLGLSMSGHVQCTDVHRTWDLGVLHALSGSLESITIKNRSIIDTDSEFIGLEKPQH